MSFDLYQGIIIVYSEIKRSGRPNFNSEVVFEVENCRLNNMKFLIVKLSQDSNLKSIDKGIFINKTEIQLKRE